MRKNPLHGIRMNRLSGVASAVSSPVASCRFARGAAAIGLLAAGCGGVQSILEPRGPQAARIASEW
jgi:hypothetical protein